MTGNARFLRACRREAVDATPVWFMRQAGRALPEYRKLRERHGLLEICRTPALAVEATLLPLKVLDVDAAILFADITLPLEGLGVRFELREGEGPVLERPIRDEEQIRSLRPFVAERDVPHVLETVAQARRALEGRVPLIGFCGAPFTLACYLVEGKGSRDYREAKGMMFSRPDLFASLLDRLTETAIDYARAQVASGVQAFQVFDSWVGCLSPGDYRRTVLPHSRRLLTAIAETGIPSIHFGTDTAGLLEPFAEAGGVVIGVDWRIPLDEAWKRIGESKGIQGNLDPALLLADFETVKRAAEDVLSRAAGRRGHVFNLGHGVLPGTPVENLRRLVDFVHERTSK